MCRTGGHDSSETHVFDLFQNDKRKFPSKFSGKCVGSYLQAFPWLLAGKRSEVKDNQHFWAPTNVQSLDFETTLRLCYFKSQTELCSA